MGTTTDTTDTTATAEQAKVTLTAEEETQIEEAAKRVWGYIAGDWLMACGGECTWEEAFEGAVDAGRLSAHGGLSRELEKKFYSMTWDDQQALGRKIFKYDTYC